MTEAVFVAAVVVSVLSALVLTGSAGLKLSHRPQVVQTYSALGVPEDKLAYLAFLLLAGSAGLVVGLFWAPLGVAAAIGLVCYFLVAVVVHIRANDAKHLGVPLALAVLAAVALVLRLATL
jgi:hypothetical protein